MKRVTCTRSAVPLALAAALTSAVVAGCAQGAASSQQSAPAVRLGMLLPQSDRSSTGGSAPAEEGARLAVGLVNEPLGDVPVPLAAGTGLPGLGGSRVGLAVGSSHSEGREADQQVSSMVEDGHAVALVATGSAEQLEVTSQRGETHKIPVVGVGSSQGFLTERGLEWFFRVGPTDTDYADAVLDLLGRQPGRATGQVAVVYPADQNGSAVAFDAAATARSRGYDAVLVPVPPPWPAPAGTVGTALASAGVSNPDGLILVADDQATAAAEVEAAQYVPGTFLHVGPDDTVDDSTDSPVVGLGDGFENPAAARTLGDRFPGLLVGSTWSHEVASRGQVPRSIGELYTERFGRPMSSDAAEAFTATYVLLRALDTAGSTDPGAIRAALLSLELPGRELVMPWDGVRFDETHNNDAARAVLDQIGDGERHLVEPADLVRPADQETPSPGSDPSTGSG